jgi:PhnB protein
MAPRNPKPVGMSWISPDLVVKDMKKALAFYEKAFGFETKLAMPGPDGNLIHAEMLHKDCYLMLSPEMVERGVISATALKGSPVTFYVYVDNVDAQFERARKAGAAVTMEPSNQFWGDRCCVVRCPEGHQWCFAQNVADFNPDNAPK